MLLLGVFWLALLIWTPYQSARLYEQSYRVQKNMIAIDNVAIRIGKLDRHLLRQVEKQIKIVNTMERIHHPVHYCAHFGIASAACISQDRALETTLKATLKKISLLKQKWRWHGFHATREAVHLQEKVCGIKRPLWPFNVKVCRQCGLKTKFAIKSHISTQVDPCENHIRGAKVKLTRNSAWNYELREP